MTPIDDKGIRLAEDVRKAIEHREHDLDLNAAINGFDHALDSGSAEQLQEAGSALLIADIEANRRYRAEIRVAFVRAVDEKLLSEDER